MSNVIFQLTIEQQLQIELSEKSGGLNKARFEWQPTFSPTTLDSLFSKYMGEIKNMLENE